MWDNLKASIASVVRTNNNQEITGANLQSVLNTIVNTVGANATFAGIAIPSTNPGTPDGPVFYIACEPGIYSNFNLTLVDGLYILENKTGSWVGTQINTGAAIEALIGYYNAVLNGASITVPEATTYRLTKGGVIRLKMLAPGTTATTLTIGNATNIPIWYNGAAVSAQNTWEANEIISVFYDGTRFMASNSQGSGGKAEKISYNNSQSGLDAENVQGAIDELHTELGGLGEQTEEQKYGLFFERIADPNAIQWTLYKNNGLVKENGDIGSYSNFQIYKLSGFLINQVLKIKTFFSGSGFSIAHIYNAAGTRIGKLNYIGYNPNNYVTTTIDLNLDEYKTASYILFNIKDYSTHDPVDLTGILTTLKAKPVDVQR